MSDRPDILFATATEALDRLEDEELLFDALATRGLRAEPAVWNDPAVAWDEPKMVVVRYAFDYPRNRDGFLAWAEKVEATTPLYNPSEVLRWNSHKTYLRELEAEGIAIVTTVWVDAGTAADLAAILEDHGWRDAVVKPAVDNGARGALRVSPLDTEPGQAQLEAILRDRDAMIQPFIDATETVGEKALIHFDGRFSHAIRKDQMLSGREFSFDRTPLTDPDPAERELAEKILARFDPPLLYARVDTIVSDGVAMLMELEAFEPVLFFSKASGSADRMADAIVARL